MEGWCMYKCNDTYGAFYQNNEVFSRLLLNLWPKAYEYIVCLASVQLFYSINFYQDNDLYLLKNIEKILILMQDLSNFSKNNNNHGKQVLQNDFNHWHRPSYFNTLPGILFRIKI